MRVCGGFEILKRPSRARTKKGDQGEQQKRTKARASGWSKKEKGQRQSRDDEDV